MDLAYLIRALHYPQADRLYHVIDAPQGRLEPGGMARLDWNDLAGVVELVDSSLLTRLHVYDGAASRGSLAEPEETFRVVGILPAEFRYARETSRGPMAFVIPLRVPAQSYFVQLRPGVPVPFAEKRPLPCLRNGQASGWNPLAIAICRGFARCCTPWLRRQASFCSPSA